MLVAGLLLGLLALRGVGQSSTVPAESISSFAAPQATPPGMAGFVTATAPSMAMAPAIATTNIYLLPDRASELVAVLPAGQRAVLTGRSEDGAWLLVGYPVGSTQRGWTRATSLATDRNALQALPVLPAGTLASAAPTVATGTATPGQAALAALPDMVITDVRLLQGDHLAVGIQNQGQAAISDVTMALTVTNLEGELIGVLSIGPASLAPGATATIVTPLVIQRAGSYRIELDPANEVAEVQKLNNTRLALLVPAKG